MVSKEQISFDEFIGLKGKAYQEIIRDNYLYLNDNRISIKKYYGMYEGLIRVDIEFQSSGELKQYQKEKWMDKEITLSSLAFDNYLSKRNRDQFLKDLYRNKMKALKEIEEDIYINHEFREDVNNRIMILHSDTLIDGKVQDGVMDVLFSKEDWYEHYHYWYKYFTSCYLDNENIREEVRDNNHDHFQFIQECLNQYHDIVFLDATDLDEEERYTYGILFLPGFITNEQYNVLEENIHYFKQFTSLAIEGGEETIDIWKSEESTINDIIEGSEFPQYLEEILRGFIKNKHK